VQQVQQQQQQQWPVHCSVLTGVFANVTLVEQHTMRSWGQIKYAE
jgi:hypothetical protein